MTTIDEAVAAADFGRPSAVKRGRNPRWPYVPIIVHTTSGGVPYTTQLLGLAYATRQEALDAAEAHIDAARTALARDLARPNYRALRRHHGVDDTEAVA